MKEHLLQILGRLIVLYQYIVMLLIKKLVELKHIHTVNLQITYQLIYMKKY